MLARLSIRDIVLIDRLDIDFGSGPAALTGETGAGKSILLDAFALALGARGDTALVREGAEQGQVTAAFDLAKDHPARRVLAENDLWRRGRTDRAPRAIRRRPHPRLRQRSAGQRAGAARARRGAGGNPRPARRARLCRCGDPSRAARCLWRHRGDAAEVRAAVGRTPRARGRGRRRIAPRSSAPAREAEWLRHAVDELGKLGAAGRRGNLARRTARHHDAGGKSRRGFARDP